MSSRTESIKNLARNRALALFRRVENHAVFAAVFSGVIVENTLKWCSTQRNQHYFLTYYKARGFLSSPCESVVGFIRDQEIAALSSLWDLSWDPPKYNTKRPQRFTVTSAASPLNDRNGASVTMRATDGPTPIPIHIPNVPSKVTDPAE